MIFWHKSKSSKGFTLVELLVTVPIFIISIAVLIGFLVTLYTELLKKDASAELALESQQVLTTIQDDLYFARNFAETVTGSVNDADGPGGVASGWSYDTSPNATLIVYEMALDKVRQDSSRAIVYQKTDASGNSCDPDNIELNPPVLNNLIYYVDSGRLKRRVLVPDPVQDRCAEPFRKQTCATNTTRSEETISGSVIVDCNADTVLSDSVQSFAIDYYDSDNNLLDLAGGDSPLQAERITVKLTLARTIASKQVEYSSQLSITKINDGDPDIQ